jgi:hypothetical protein
VPHWNSGQGLNRISGLATRLLTYMLYLGNTSMLLRLLVLAVDRQMLPPHQHHLGVAVGGVGPHAPGGATGGVVRRALWGRRKRSLGED